MQPQSITSSVVITCPACGKVFARKNRNRRADAKFEVCSQVCQYNYRRTQGPRRFWTHVAVGNSDECWIWIASRNRKGYGTTRIGGGSTAAHRKAWELTFGPIPEGTWVLHHCDNPPCCNPSHLFLGTNADNVADKMAKQRHRNGGRSTAKLTIAQVRDIRHRYAAGGIFQRALAKEYGVSQVAISAIVRRKIGKGIV